MCVAGVIVCGSLQGILHVYKPMDRNFRVEDQVLERDMQQPILQISAGRFTGYLICKARSMTECFANFGEGQNTKNWD